MLLRESSIKDNLQRLQSGDEIGKETSVKPWLVDLWFDFGGKIITIVKSKSQKKRESLAQSRTLWKGQFTELTAGIAQWQSIGLPSRFWQTPRMSPEAANPHHLSLLSDFLSPPICLNLPHFVPRMDTIWTPILPLQKNHLSNLTCTLQ